ncbi:ATP-binding protein [Streptomyces sp. NPDC127084]|uniref:ATP-binding protein n=1 Tax=Streptomyces sp. NPDC127084 TaxID=3347133 RepID=UPI003646E6C4
MLKEPQAGGEGCPTLRQAGYAFGGDTGCIAEARDHAGEFLARARAEQGLEVSSRATELTRLVVSELVTNACKYAPGPVLMELGITETAIEVVVWDSDPNAPAARTTDPSRIGRHGLEIVKAVTQMLDVERQAVGKRVSARIALRDTQP